MKRFPLLLLITFFFCCSHLYAQQQVSTPLPDTIHLKLYDAEQLFLKNNLSLLAQKYNVDASKALVLQAKLWPNPTLSLEQGIYNPNTNKYFDITQTGETAAELDELIHIAGQRNKNVQIAKLNAQIAGYSFYNLLRTLKYTLRTDFFDLYFLLRSDKIYDKETVALSRLIDQYTIQVQKGFQSKAELLRLKAQQIALQSERVTLYSSIIDKESELTLLLHDSAYIIPDVNTDSVNNVSASSVNFQQLQQTAIDNRYDIKASQLNTQLQQDNLSLQRSLAIPDLTLGVRYDRAGSYIENYNGLTLSFNLPVFDRNQGNIQQAKYLFQASQIQYQSSQDSLNHELQSAYKKALDADNLLKNFSSASFTEDYTEVINGVLENFSKHNISMLEFLDYYDSYKQSIIEMNQLQSNRMDAFETLNYTTGKTLFSY